MMTFLLHSNILNFNVFSQLMTFLKNKLYLNVFHCSYIFWTTIFENFEVKNQICASGPLGPLGPWGPNPMALDH